MANGEFITAATKAVVGQVPSLAVLAVVVWMFLSYLENLSAEQTRERAASAIELGLMIDDIRTGCHDIQVRAIDAMLDNTKMLGEVAEAVRGFDK